MSSPTQPPPRSGGNRGADSSPMRLSPHGGRRFAAAVGVGLPTRGSCLTPGFDLSLSEDSQLRGFALKMR